MRFGAVMGVDPGTQGAAAVILEGGAVAHVGVLRPGMTLTQAVQVVQRAYAWLRAYGGNVCYFEHQQHRGRADSGAKARNISTFLRATGRLEGALVALGARLRTPSPQMWQAYMNCLSGGNKKVTRIRALGLFPKEKPTNLTADALLIAEYGRRRLLVAEAGE